MASPPQALIGALTKSRDAFKTDLVGGIEGTIAATGERMLETQLTLSRFKGPIPLLRKMLSRRQLQGFVGLPVGCSTAFRCMP
jgi:hypothetical protein